MTGRRAVPLLRCYAGDLPIGLAAEEVLEFRALVPESPHINAILGLRPSPPDPQQRSLLLSTAEASAVVNVDGPVRIRNLVPGEMLRIPRLFTRIPIQPLLGFAEQDGRIVLLLDVARVVRMARPLTPTASLIPAQGNTP